MICKYLPNNLLEKSLNISVCIDCFCPGKTRKYRNNLLQKILVHYNLSTMKDPIDAFPGSLIPGIDQKYYFEYLDIFTQGARLGSIHFPLPQRGKLNFYNSNYTNNIPYFIRFT